MSTTDDERRRRRDAELARKEQREVSDRARKSNDEGRWFHYGMATIRGEVARNGWQHEQRTKLPSGRERIHDAARAVNEHEFREYKAGRSVGGEFVLEQISKEHELLRTDPKAKGAWIVREGALDPAVRRELEKLEREFKGRFSVIEVTHKQAGRAMEVGLDLERDRNQMELFDSTDLRNKQLARDRREKAQEKQLVREAAERAIDQQERERKEREKREVQKRREQEERQKQREAADRLAQRTVERRAATARGERTPMSGREAADVLRLGPPTPGAESRHRHEHPRAGSTRHNHTRERDRERDRNRGLERGS